MTQNYSIARCTAERLGLEKDDGDNVSLRIKVAPFLSGTEKIAIVMVPDYEQGCIQVVYEESLQGSVPGERIAGMDDAIKEDADGASLERVRRLRAASEFRATVTGQKLTIPSEIAWLVRRDNSDRDVTLVFLPDLLEIWPTQRWQDYLAGHLFGRAE